MENREKYQVAKSALEAATTDKARHQRSANSMIVVWPSGRQWRIYAKTLTAANFNSFSQGSRVFQASEIALPNPTLGASGPVRVNMNTAAAVWFVAGEAKSQVDDGALEKSLIERGRRIKADKKKAAREAQAELVEKLKDKAIP